MSVYFDNNATTPLHPDVKKELEKSISIFENPSALYSSGNKVRSMVDKARANCAALIHADSKEVIFTSGGTESNNTILNSNFIKNLINKNSDRNEIIISAIEHPSVMNCIKILNNQGFKTYITPVDSNGNIIIERFTDLLSEKTCLVSIMLANNEIGAIQDIQKLSELSHRKGALFHTDAVQAVGKIPVNVKTLDIDYLSYSGHKLYCCKGIGALYVKQGVPFIPLISGGGQEFGRRSGTENIHGILGIGKATEIIRKSINNWQIKYSELKQYFIHKLSNSIDNIVFNSNERNCLSQTVSVSFLGTQAEVVLLYLDKKGIQASTGSACSSGSQSYVLKAIGLDNKTADSTIRFSFGIYNNLEQIDYSIDILQKIITDLRGG